MEVFGLRNKLSKRADSPGKRDSETIQATIKMLPKMLTYLSQEVIKYEGSGVDPYFIPEIKEGVMDAEALLYEVIMHYKYL